MLHIQPGITAIIGAGGKTTLLRALADELSPHARVIVATSTKMYVPDWCPVLLEDDGERDDEKRDDEKRLLLRLEAALADASCVCIGAIHKPTGKLQASHLEFSRLANMADYVLVEADGAKMLPLKAHAEHEPVIPGGTQRVVCVVGANGLGAPVSQVCHRPHLFAQLAGISESDAVTPEAVTAVLNAESLHDVVLVNKVETAAEWDAAEHIATLSRTPVVAGSLWRGEFRCLR